MRKLYNEFFYVPKHAKIREKVMLTRVVMTVAVMVMCLLAMGLTAYAYFACDITSEHNTIKTATFKTAITVTDSDGNNVPLSTSDNRSFKPVELNPGEYNVKIEVLELQSTAQTGFVVVKAGGKTYHTVQLVVDEKAKGGNTSELEFELVLTDKAEVTFVAHWGTSSHYPAYTSKGANIENGEKIKFIINGIEELPVNNTQDGEQGINDTDSDEETTPPEEQSETVQDDDSMTPPENTESEGGEQTEPDGEDVEQTDIEQTDTEDPAMTQEGADTENKG